MTYGPCGGVRDDGTCEMAAMPCPFDVLVPWPTPVPPPPRPQVPLVLADFSAPPFEPRALIQVAEILAAGSDAVLVGEHQNRPDYPPTLIAAQLRAAGANPWVTLACRDRNRVVLEQELRGLAYTGVDVVLCVTGDGRAYDVRPEVTQVFDLDGPRLASLAASLGLVAAVPESPAAPPYALRPRRLVEKQRAGASVAILNHTRDVAHVGAFVAAARAAGLTIPVIAAVSVYTDLHSASALQGLPGLEIDPAAIAEVLGAADPVEAGIEAAVTEARALLAIDGVNGVNVSGPASAQGHLLAAEIKAEIGIRVKKASG